jgi:hypothetical protein
MTVRFTDRELATLLAALRYWQQGLDDNDGEAPLRDHFEDEVTPLTPEEINDLCERLNCGPVHG